MGWRTIYIENSHKLSLYLNNLKIEDGDERYIVPIDDIEVLVLNNYKMYVTTQLLCKLSQENVCVIICDKKGLPELMLNPLAGNYASFRLQEVQLNLKETQKQQLWKKIIEGKIGNQVKVLDGHSGDCDTLEYMLKFMKEVLPGDPENREGLAAKLYFRGLFGREFTRDRKNEDSVNMALNYGYAVLRAIVARSVVAKGYIPTIGIHHRNIYNPFNLADDFMEPYRPLIDDWVYRNMGDDFFTREKRLSLLESFHNKIIFEEKKYSILQSVPLYVDHIVNYMKSGDECFIQMPGVEIVEECE